MHINIGEATMKVVFNHEDVKNDVQVVFLLHDDTPAFVKRLGWRFKGKDAFYTLARGWCHVRLNSSVFPTADAIFNQIDNDFATTDISSKAASTFINKYGKGKRYIRSHHLFFTCPGFCRRSYICCYICCSHILYIVMLYL
jgi:hypothetical protein